MVWQGMLHESTYKAETTLTSERWPQVCHLQFYNIVNVVDDTEQR